MTTTLAGEPKPRDPKFLIDLVWNFGSLGIIAVSGLAMNIVIARYYGPAVVGVFGTVLAIFAIAGQAAVGGFVYSLLHYLPRFPDEPETRHKVTATAIGATIILATVVSLALWLASEPVAALLDSPDLGRGLRLVAPAVFMFAINKCLLFTLNGRRRMRLFAVGQSLRVVTYLSVLVAFAASGVDGTYVPAALAVGEAVLLVFLLATVGHDLAVSPRLFDREWIGRIFRFGRNGYLIGFLADINIKVDVIMLGYFMDDRQVGYYVFMAMFAEGMGQLSGVLQNNLNPLIARLSHEERLHQVADYVRRLHVYFLPAMIVAAAVSTLLLPFISDLLTGDPSFGAWWPVFAVLAGGIAITSGVMPMVMVLTQVGRPELQAVFFATLIVINIGLNLALIPLLGIIGAACATTVTNLLAVGLLFGLFRRATGYSMWRRRS